MNILECYYIDLYDTFKNGYNSTTGGCKGTKLTEEVKQKITKGLKGHKMSKLCQEKFTFKDRRHTLKYKQDLSKR